MDVELRLAELLSTRLCHDLTGPIGAVNNGAEFLGEDGFSMQEQALELIIGSARQAVVRLQFYRQAYGRVNNQGEACLGETRELAGQFFADSRFELAWPQHYADAAGVSVSRKMAKLALNILIFVSSAMPRGGRLDVTIVQREGHTEICVHGQGEGVREDAEVMSAFRLQTNIADITPKTVQPYFMARLARSLNVPMRHEISSKHFAVTAVHP